MTRFPSVQSVSIKHLVSNYGATFFHAAFARFVILWQNPQITCAHLEQDILDVHIPFTCASIYHRIRFIDDNLGKTTVDLIRIWPQQFDKKGQADTSLVYTGDKDKAGIHGALLFMIDVLYLIATSISCWAGPAHFQYQQYCQEPSFWRGQAQPTSTTSSLH
jgi:hypothetical protein